MAEPPRFSVCIPNYNNGRFIGETIRSVLAQTCQDFEIVVSDNASTDDSVAVVESFGLSRLRLLRNPQNVGLAANFDRVAEASTGCHLILLSADDVMRPRALETYGRVLDELGPDAPNAVLISAYDGIDAGGDLLYAMFRPRGEVFYRMLDAAHANEADTGGAWEASDGLDVLAQALRRRLAPAPFLATCYPRRLYDRVGGYRSGFRAWPDTHFVLKLLSEGPRLVYVPQRLFAYRVHEGNQFTIFDRQRALFYQVDSYLHVEEFPERVLRAVGVDRSELVAAYLTRAIFGRAQRAIARGAPALALRYLLFGMATHPRQWLRRPAGYALAALAATGPVGRHIATRLPER